MSLLRLKYNNLDGGITRMELDTNSGMVGLSYSDTILRLWLPSTDGEYLQ